jgi:hypothetical protein
MSGVVGLSLVKVGSQRQFKSQTEQLNLFGFPFGVLATLGKPCSGIFYKTDSSQTITDALLEVERKHRADPKNAEVLTRWASLLHRQTLETLRRFSGDLKRLESTLELALSKADDALELDPTRGSFAGRFSRHSDMCTWTRGRARCILRCRCRCA